jgi:hypothetical protein
MAKENDGYLGLERKEPIDWAYAGISMRVDHGWIPDFVEAVVDGEAKSCRLTLIEVEATETAALVSCRKYLPEDSRQIARRFGEYLDIVIGECRSRADGRGAGFEELKEFLAAAPRIRVHTAGGLRTTAELIEDRALVDQPAGFEPAPVRAGEAAKAFTFEGKRKFSRAESEGLRRAVRILHAVISGNDRSDSMLMSWRDQRNKPMERDVGRDPGRWPRLEAFLRSRTDNGLIVDGERLSDELSAAWIAFEERRIPPKRAAALISRFAPEAMGFAMHEPMQGIFERAREVIRETG